jgi:hypothetical protein
MIYILVLPCIFLAKCDGWAKKVLHFPADCFPYTPKVVLGNINDKFQYDTNYFPLN